MDAQLTVLVEQHLAAAAAGDRDAFARIVDGSRVLVASIALAIVRDAELSRDIAQDVFLAAWRDLKQLRDPRSFVPWLRQLTRNRAYHVLRTERRRERRITNAQADSLLETAVDGRPVPDSVLLADEDRQVLAAVLDELPDETREVVTLYYREGQSTAQVAGLLGLSEVAVRKRLSRARATLRENLMDHFADMVRQTAPGTAFTGAVMTALAVGAPTAASAATVSTATAVAGASLFSKLLAIGGSATLPAAGGIAGVLLGSRQLKRQARTADELLGLRRFETVSVLLVIGAAVAFPTTWLLTSSPWSQVATFLTFLAGLASLHHVWLPRIIRPRLEAEMAEDPERATRTRARERRIAIIGWTLGVLSGSAGLIAGLWLV